MRKAGPSLPTLLVLSLLLLPAAGAATPGARASEMGDTGGGVPVADDLRKRKADLLLRLRVKRAIDRGALWIARQQQKDGSFKLKGNALGGPFPESRHGFGVSSLCFYTLADCGYTPDQSEIKKALSYLRKHYRGQMGKGDYWPKASSYSLSLFVLGLHTLYVKPGHRSKRVQRDRYGHQKKTRERPCGYPKWARGLIEEILDWLLAHEAKTGLFRYPDGFNLGTRPAPMPGMLPSHEGPEDLSNTQYVLLALWAGSRCGYEIQIATLEKIAHRLLAYQEASGPAVARTPDPKPADKKQAAVGAGRYAPPSRPGGQPSSTRNLDQARGFPYTLGSLATGSMTAAGLSSLFIVKAMLLERHALRAAVRKQLDRGIWDAIAWLTWNYDLHANPPGVPLWQYYYLYGLERACVISGKRFLGEHEWYPEGARMLVTEQEEDGRWRPGNQLGGFGGLPGAPSTYRTDVLDTCFALLFLKRAALIPRRPVLDDGPVTTPREK